MYFRTFNLQLLLDVKFHHNPTIQLSRSWEFSAPTLRSENANLRKWYRGYSFYVKFHSEYVILLTAPTTPLLLQNHTLVSFSNKKTRKNISTEGMEPCVKISLPHSPYLIPAHRIKLNDPDKANVQIDTVNITGHYPHQSLRGHHPFP